MLNACHEIGEYAAKASVTFAIESGPEKAVTLRRLLDDATSSGLGVNLDPANLTMVSGDDAVQAVYTLGQYIVHTHAKDGIQKQAGDPVALYHGPKESPHPAPVIQETHLGKGEVNWDSYLDALEEVGYRGFLCVECESSPDPVGDIARAIGFLRKKLQ